MAEITEPSWDEPEVKEYIKPTKAQHVEQMVTQIVEALALTSSHKFEVENAKALAGLCLQAQIEMSEFLADLEWRCKDRKNNLAAVESDVYLDFKDSADKKPSDAILTQMTNRSEKVKIAKRELIDEEKEYKKFSYIMGTCREAHVYFRNLNTKNDW